MYEHSYMMQLTLRIVANAIHVFKTDGHNRHFTIVLRIY